MIWVFSFYYMQHIHKIPILWMNARKSGIGGLWMSGIWEFVCSSISKQTRKHTQKVCLIAKATGDFICFYSPCQHSGFQREKYCHTHCLKPKVPLFDAAFFDAPKLSFFGSTNNSQQTERFKFCNWYLLTKYVSYCIRKISSWCVLTTRTAVWERFYCHTLAGVLAKSTPLEY